LPWAELMALKARKRLEYVEPSSCAMGKGRSWTAALTSLRKRLWSARMRPMQSESAADASMLMRDISPSLMQLTSGSNAATHWGRSRLTSTARYDPQRRHIATVAMATSPKCSWDLGRTFSSLVVSSTYERTCRYMVVCGDEMRREGLWPSATHSCQDPASMAHCSLRLIVKKWRGAIDLSPLTCHPDRCRAAC